MPWPMLSSEPPRLLVMSPAEPPSPIEPSMPARTPVREPPAVMKSALAVAMPVSEPVLSMEPVSASVKAPVEPPLASTEPVMVVTEPATLSMTFVREPPWTEPPIPSAMSPPEPVKSAEPPSSADPWPMPPVEPEGMTPAEPGIRSVEPRSVDPISGNEISAEVMPSRMGISKFPDCAAATPVALEMASAAVAANAAALVVFFMEGCSSQ